ncbi:signal recognition particle 19 kDa protein [Eurytemora carolleeae]|uniref:signal recognition particle 19 kDa protein n=1 Tax=Eurytemora carolleeae TaxID=1294199 RepID=UPI000C77F6E7|nr:signal recognition particle 19 kDa protein [Eurytemora carolleeae]|eukprot:XP_023327588.1 signal recognition particle 19 kDa protein-like [Eurytemora affinis]
MSVINPGHPNYTHRPGPPQLGPFNRTKTHDDPERWICVYPAYLNKKKTLKEGRDIKAVLDDAKMEYILERKFYSRERSKEPTYIGRFKVHLKDKEGEYLKEEFQSRNSILLYLGEKIPQLKSRTNPKGPAAEQPQQQQTGAVPKKKKGKK